MEFGLDCGGSANFSFGETRVAGLIFLADDAGFFAIKVLEPSTLLISVDGGYFSFSPDGFCAWSVSLLTIVLLAARRGPSDRGRVLIWERSSLIKSCCFEYFGFLEGRGLNK